MISITGWGPSASYTSREVKPPAAIVVHPEHSPDQCPDVRNIQCSLCYSFSFCIMCIFKFTDRGASRSYFKNFCPRPRPRSAYFKEISLGDQMDIVI